MACKAVECPLTCLYVLLAKIHSCCHPRESPCMLAEEPSSRTAVMLKRLTRRHFGYRGVLICYDLFLSKMPRELMWVDWTRGIVQFVFISLCLSHKHFKKLHLMKVYWEWSYCYPLLTMHYSSQTKNIYQTCSESHLMFSVEEVIVSLELLYQKVNYVMPNWAKLGSAFNFY